MKKSFWWGGQNPDLVSALAPFGLVEVGAEFRAELGNKQTEQFIYYIYYYYLTVIIQPTGLIWIEAELSLGLATIGFVMKYNKLAIKL